MQRRIKALLAGAVVALAFGSGLWAQSLSPTGLTGLEVWSCATGGPGGPSVFCNTSLMRNTAGYTLVTVTTGTVTATTQSVRYIYTGAYGTGALNTPAIPFDGQMLEIINGTGSNFVGTITLTAVGTQTVNNGGVTNLTAGSSKEWQYVLSTNTWYSLR
jgi:hypothetical protein